MYPFPSDRHLDCPRSLPSKTMLEWASFHLSPYGLCRASLDEEPKSGTARSEVFSALPSSRLSLKCYASPYSHQPCLQGSHFPHSHQPLVLWFSNFCQIHGQKMMSGSFNLPMLLKSPHIPRAIPDLNSKGCAKGSFHPRTGKNFWQMCSFSPGNFVYLLLPPALGSTHSRWDSEGWMTDPWVVQPVITRTTMRIKVSWPLTTALPTRLCWTRSPSVRDGLSAKAWKCLWESWGFCLFLFCIFNQLHWSVVHIQ